jgi:hypothetical protein
MTAAEYYDKLATADIDADEQALKELAVSGDAPQLVRFYAAHKADAIKARLAGDITKAQRDEGQCDWFYNTMPKRYRW